LHKEFGLAFHFCLFLATDGEMHANGEWRLEVQARKCEGINNLTNKGKGPLITHNNDSAA